MVSTESSASETNGSKVMPGALGSPGPEKATMLEFTPEKLKKMGGHGEETASSQGPPDPDLVS